MKQSTEFADAGNPIQRTKQKQNECVNDYTQEGTKPFRRNVILSLSQANFLLYCLTENKH